MKKITTLFVLLVFILSTVSAVAEQNAVSGEQPEVVAVSAKNVQEIDDEIPNSIMEKARNQDSVALCVRYLKNKYPDATAVRLNAICQRLKAQVAKGNIDKTDIAQARMLTAERLRAFANLDADKRKLLLNMKPEVRARLARLDNDKLQRLVNLDRAQLEKLKLMDRSRLKKLADKDPKEIKAALDKFRVKRINLQDLYRQREIAKNRLEIAKRRYNQAKERYEKAKENLEKARKEFRAAVEKGDEEAAVEHAKEYLLHVADIVINSLEKIKATTEEDDDLTEEEANEIIADLDEKIVKIEDLKDQVEAAQTKDEVKEAGIQIINAWKRMRHKIRLQAGRIIKSKVMDVLKRVEQLESRLDKALAKLEEQGYDVSDVDDLVDQFSSKIDSARDKFRDASDKFKEAHDLADNDNASQEEITNLVDEGKSLVKEAHNDLKEAHELFKEIVRKIKGIAGDDAETALEQSEENEVEVIEEIECTTDAECSENQVCEENECKDVEEEEIDDEKETEVEYEDLCEDNEGTWLEDYSECEYLSQEVCEENGGTFSECASACRHDSEAEICTLQCVPLCTFA